MGSLGDFKDKIQPRTCVEAMGIRISCHPIFGEKSPRSTDGMKVTRTDVAKYIEDFLSGKDGPYDWDNFISVRIKNDADLEAMRLRIGGLPDQYPADRGGYCNEEGIKVLRQILDELRFDIDH